MLAVARCADFRDNVSTRLSSVYESAKVIFCLLSHMNRFTLDSINNGQELSGTINPPRIGHRMHRYACTRVDGLESQRNADEVS